MKVAFERIVSKAAMACSLTILVFMGDVSAYAGPTCATFSECVSTRDQHYQVVSELEFRMQELLNAAFTQETRPKYSAFYDFGPAWRDPSNLLWSSGIRENGRLLELTYDQAESYCSRLGNGARPPTWAEYEAFDTYFGLNQFKTFDWERNNRWVFPDQNPSSHSSTFFWTSTPSSYGGKIKAQSSLGSVSARNGDVNTSVFLRCVTDL